MQRFASLILSLSHVLSRLASSSYSPCIGFDLACHALHGELEVNHPLCAIGDQGAHVGRPHSHALHCGIRCVCVYMYVYVCVSEVMPEMCCITDTEQQHTCMRVRVCQ